MDRVRVELVGPLLIEEEPRRAEQERLLVAIDRTTPRVVPPIARLGSLLIRLGDRLERFGAPQPAPRLLPIVTDPCGGCAR